MFGGKSFRDLTVGVGYDSRMTISMVSLSLLEDDVQFRVRASVCQCCKTDNRGTLLVELKTFTEFPFADGRSVVEVLAYNGLQGVRQNRKGTSLGIWRGGKRNVQNQNDKEIRRHL